jgi:hypothetical protein
VPETSNPLNGVGSWVQKQEYFEKNNRDKINEYRRRKYAENKEAKNISV